MSYELGIEVAQTEERLQFFDCSGYRPLGNCVDFLRIHRYCGVFHDVAKILQFCKTECTLFAFCFELVFTQFSKHPTQVFCMVVFIFRENQYIIKIHHCKYIKFLCKNVIHESLECRWGVNQSKR